MATTITKPIVSVRLESHRLAIRSQCDQSLVGFLRSLPNSKWNAGMRVWVCDATPAACWRLLDRCRVEAPADVLALAAEFVGHGGTPPEGARRLPLWAHQQDAYQFAAPRAGAMLALRMGEGKSACAIALVADWRCESTLIVCPKSVVPVWPSEFEKHSAAGHRVLALTAGSVKRKREIAEEFRESCRRSKVPAVIVINYESARTKEFADWALTPENRWECVILDESHRIKTPDAAVSKFAHELSHNADRRLCLTGTPMGSPLDLFSQFRFLDRGLLGTSYHAFRYRYADFDKQFPSKVLRWHRQDELQQRFRMLAFRVDGDVLSLPAANHHRLSCALSSEATKAYEQLENNLRAEVGRGEVTASNGLVKLLRLQQLTSGFAVSDDDGPIVEVDQSKRAALTDLIDGLDPAEKVVVFCRFLRDLDTVREVAEALGRMPAELSGRRNDLDGHRYPESATVLGVQIQSGGVGIDLTAARYCCYYSLGFSLLDYEQSLARVHRPGQTRPVHYYHLVASDTVDEAVYGALRNKRDVVSTVLEALQPKD